MNDDIPVAQRVNQSVETPGVVAARAVAQPATDPQTGSQTTGNDPYDADLVATPVAVPHAVPVPHEIVVPHEIAVPHEPAPHEVAVLHGHTAPPQAGEASRAHQVSRPGWVRWTLRKVGSTLRFSFCLASLIALLAVLSAIPVLQLIAFGYLLDVAGRLTRGGKFLESLPNLRRAGMIGMAASAIFIASLPTQLLVHWESVAQLITPDSAQAGLLRLFAVASSVIATFYLLWAWVRGGRLMHYLWPQPKRFFKESWRWQTWSSVPDQLWDFTVALEMPRLFWLGLRGAIGTLVWLVPGMIIIMVVRNGNSGAAGLLGGLSMLGMGLVLFYLPMLQAHFAAENRLRALFEVGVIRDNFRRAPWAWFFAMVIGLVLMPIPLYLLKIEATPREVDWLPCLVFIAFILPARIAEGLALRRARRRPLSQTWWAFASRWTVRVLMFAVVGTYLAFLVASQFTSWDGLPTWVEQHAILFPRPFIGGV